MKLTINPGDGTITVDTPDNVSAAEFVRELLSGAKPPPPPKAIEAKSERIRPRPHGGLSRELTETVEWLETHDTAAGVTSDKIAAGLGITKFACQYRMGKLVKKGVARRVTADHYRATWKPAKKQKLAPPKADRQLSRALDETWAFLANLDTTYPEGVSTAQVADKFHLTPSGASQRLYELVSRGMAHRISMGRYKVGPGYDDISSLNGSLVR